ncbi:MAG: hypothetical protein WBO49_04205 [Candidatus Saccharimonas sp.]
MAYQYPLNGGRINASVGGNSTSAGAGYQLVSTGTLTLAGGNNITLSQNGPAITISGANFPSQTAYQFSNSNGVSFGTNGSTITATVATNYAASNHSHGNPTLNLTNLSGTTASASNGLTLSLSAPAVSSLSQTGIISLSQNGNTISIGAPAFSAGISTLGNTAGTTGTVSNQLIFAGGNNITLSQSTGAGGNTISISGANIPVQTAFSFSNSNGVSFGTNGSTVTASVATNYAASNHSHGNPTLALTNISGTTASASNGLTLSLSAAAQSNQNISLYALGNTTQNSSTLLNASNLSFNGLGGATVGFSNGSIQVSGATGGGGGDGGVALYDGANSISSGTARISASGALTASVNGQTLNFSVPATSSLSGAGGISLSTNGSTIIVSNNNTLNYYQNMDRGNSSTLAVPFASMMIQRLNQENGLFAGNITANTVLLNMTANMTATSLSSSHTVSVSIGIYSDNASNLTLINSASTSWALGAATGNTSNYNGPRWLSFVSSQWSSAPNFAQGGEYVFGIRFSTSNYAPPLSYFGQNYMLSNQRSGFIGTSMATATTLGQGNYWNGVINTTALPSSIAASQVNRNNASAIFIPHIILNNRYSGTM